MSLVSRRGRVDEGVSGQGSVRGGSGVGYWDGVGSDSWFFVFSSVSGSEVEILGRRKPQI